MEKIKICKCGHAKDEHPEIGLVSSTLREIKDGVDIIQKTVYPENTITTSCSKCRCNKFIEN